MGVSGGIEPRSGGIQELEIDVTNPLGMGAAVTVNCLNAGDVSDRVSATSVVGNTVTVLFGQPLPDNDACTVTLDCEASVCVAGVRGDINGDGVVSTADASIIKPKFGQVPTNATAQFDYNVDGFVSTADFSQVKPLFGNAPPACP